MRILALTGTVLVLATTSGAAGSGHAPTVKELQTQLAAAEDGRVGCLSDLSRTQELLQKANDTLEDDLATIKELKARLREATSARPASTAIIQSSTSDPMSCVTTCNAKEDGCVRHAQQSYDGAMSAATSTSVGGAFALALAGTEGRLSATHQRDVAISTARFNLLQQQSLCETTAERCASTCR